MAEISQEKRETIIRDWDKLDEPHKQKAIRLGIQPPGYSQPLGQSQPQAQPALHAPVQTPPSSTYTPPGPTEKRQFDTEHSQRAGSGLPTVSKQQQAWTVRGQTQGVLPQTALPGDYSKLSEKGQDWVNKQIEADEENKGFSKRLKDARPHFEQIEAINLSESIARDLYPLLNMGTVGLGGWLTVAWSTLTQQLGVSKDQYRIPFDQAVRKVEEVRKRVQATGDLKKTLLQAEADQPGSAALLNPGAPAVQVMASVLAYLHATGLKKATGGTRGITREDIVEANKLFDPTKLNTQTNPEALRERLVWLYSEFLKPAREDAQHQVMLMGINPTTRKAIQGFRFRQYATESPTESAPEPQEAQ